MLTGIFTLLGVWLANRSSLNQLTVKLRHESERESKESLRARLEELYSLVSRWANEVGIHHLTYRRVMDGDLTYNQALDITIKHKPAVDANRMFTLAELYFPSAHESLQSLKSFRDEAAAIQSSFKQAYKMDGQPSKKHSQALTLLLGEFDLAAKKYQEALAAYAKDV